MNHDHLLISLILEAVEVLIGLKLKGLACELYQTFILFPISCYHKINTTGASHLIYVIIRPQAQTEAKNERWERGKQQWNFVVVKTKISFS